MHNKKRGISRVAAVLFLLATIYLTPSCLWAANSPGDFLTVQTRPVTFKIDAYGQIKPVAIVKVRALAQGDLSQLNVVPGMIVSAHQVLAQLTGPLMQSQLTTGEQNLQRARAQARSANQALRIARHKYAAQLTTQQRLDTAIGNLAAAQASVKIAHAKLQEIQNMQTLRSPVDGIVSSVESTNGEQLTANQVVLTIQPTNKLWLRAAYYGVDSAKLHIGMSGYFKPADNRKPIAVKIIAIAPNLSSDSGRDIVLIPDSTPDPTQWISGSWGKLTLTGKTVPMISVPTSALILDRGNWWVLLHTPHGDIPHQVVPGKAYGWSTTIRAGLMPGQQIVINNPFLRYHRGIANTYTPPD